MKIRGIYKIINRINGKYYVGSSDDIERRWNNHRIDLNKNIHHNKHLQNAWNKYGSINFDFIITETILNKSILLKKEQDYLNECKNNSNMNYNICYNSSAPMAGRHHSIITLEKMSISQSGENNPMYGKVGANKGKKSSIETRMKISKNNGRYWKGKTFTEDHRQKLCGRSGKNNALFGSKRTVETKEKIGLSRRDKTIFNFNNTETNETWTGTTFDFSQKFNLLPNSVRSLIKGKMKHLYNWVVNF